MSNLRIGLPSKGRLADDVAELFRQAGLSFGRQERNLFTRVGELPVDITFLRAKDIPVLCAEGAIDMGITGGDLVEEAGADLDTRLEMGFGKCRLSLCVPEDSTLRSPSELKGRRVATSFSRTAERFFQRHEASVHLVPLTGSVEIMISLGVADAIVDLVQTGSTLTANSLRVLTDIGHYQSVLVQNRERRRSDVADRVVRRLEGVVIARGWSLLEYNIPKDRMAEAQQITPGFKSPTVTALGDPSWYAVQVMVKREGLIGVMDRLEAIGATAILETRINNSRL